MGLLSRWRLPLQYKIILPFLALTLLVALVGALLALLVFARSAQDRVNNQVVILARNASDEVARQENLNLDLLYQIVFAQANPAAKAPAIPFAVATRDTPGLERGLDPYFQLSLQRRGAVLDRLIVFDNRGISLVDWETTLDNTGELKLKRNALRDLSGLWFTSLILKSKSDASGDKYAGLLDLGDGSTGYLFTVAPVVENNIVVGGAIVATRVDTTLQTIRENLLAAGVTLYSAQDGKAFASTHAFSQDKKLTQNILSQLNIQPDKVAEIGGQSEARERSVLNTVRISDYNYIAAYAPLVVRNSVVGLLSVELSSDYVGGSIADARSPLIGLTVALMLCIIAIGLYISRQITQPLDDLVTTAEAVTSGNLHARSSVAVRDEIGLLAGRFNTMTDSLQQLVDTVRAESGQRAAILESIADGIVVCDVDGNVLVMNRAARELVGLRADDPNLRTFTELPLLPLDEQALNFGALRTRNLFALNNHVIRLVSAPVLDEQHARHGDVYVLQDLTDEVAIDRAKTNFISTISHELRTPLTVLGASTELMQRELVGPLTTEQRNLVDSMRRHTLGMTTALNNVIAIAGLESGTQSFIIEPLDFHMVLDDLLWSVRPPIKHKGLNLVVNVPATIAPVLADRQQLRNALFQLLDNARRYTDNGEITITAEQRGDHVRVDIADTGRGISPELAGDLFTRFTRGAEGINSGERGIGLGLAIAKLVIERLGGTVWLEQSSTDGSVFSLTLPCETAKPHYHENSLASAA